MAIFFFNYSEQTVKQCGARPIKGGINLYVKLQPKHKLVEIAARNIRISLHQCIVSKESYGVS